MRCLIGVYRHVFQRRRAVYYAKQTAAYTRIGKRCVHYAKNVTLWNDIKLFFGTFLAVFKGGSASGADSDAKVEKREYYYADHLLKSKQITKDQYDLGLNKAKDITNQKRKGKVEFQEDLHKVQVKNDER